MDLSSMISIILNKEEISYTPEAILQLIRW